MTRNHKFLNPEGVCFSSFAAVDWQGIRSAIDGNILICTRIHAMNVSALGMNRAGVVGRIGFFHVIFILFHFNRNGMLFKRYYLVIIFLWFSQLLIAQTKPISIGGSYTYSVEIGDSIHDYYLGLCSSSNEWFFKENVYSSFQQLDSSQQSSPCPSGGIVELENNQLLGQYNSSSEHSIILSWYENEKRTARLYSIDSLNIVCLDTCLSANTKHRIFHRTSSNYMNQDCTSALDDLISLKWVFMEEDSLNTSFWFLFDSLAPHRMFSDDMIYYKDNEIKYLDQSEEYYISPAGENTHSSHSE